MPLGGEGKSSMALPVDLDRAATFGISSPFSAVSDVYYTDPVTGRATLNMTLIMTPLGDVPRALANMPKYQTEVTSVGFSGWGMDVQLFYYLFPTFFWFVGFVILRYLSHEPLARLGIYAGVVSENRQLLSEGNKGSKALTPRSYRKNLKFANQIWFAAFYIVSTIFGYWVQRDKPWFGLPLSLDNSINMILPHPYNPPQLLLTYYHYGLAFYFSEVLSLVFLESQIKRSDFIEYVTHHVITIALIIFSHIGYEHRFGAYVLFIHDASDIMLSVAKSMHYIVGAEDERERSYNTVHRRLGDGKVYSRSFIFRYVFVERVTNLFFAMFVVGFFFFRLVCLPSVLCATVGMAPTVRHGNFDMWFLVFLLNGALQALHVYWAWLIVKMVANLARGGERKDIRSGDDDADAPAGVDATLLADRLPGITVAVRVGASSNAEKEPSCVDASEEMSSTEYGERSSGSLTPSQSTPLTSSSSSRR